jgi:hypothetical protein
MPTVRSCLTSMMSARWWVFADTLAAVLYAYPYDGATGTVGERRTFANMNELGGMPDGACADNQGGVWSCVLGRGQNRSVHLGGATGNHRCRRRVAKSRGFGGAPVFGSRASNTSMARTSGFSQSSSTPRTCEHAARKAPAVLLFMRPFLAAHDQCSTKPAPVAPAASMENMKIG